MSDLFHPDVPVDFIHKVWAVMKETRRHTYQILTKRPDRMAQILQDGFDILPNVWLGTSVEDKRVIYRLDELRKVPAAVRFVSYEPLIGSVAGGTLDGIQWAIVGGESGPNARPMDREWIDEIFDQCTDAGAAFFFKQWGGKNKKAAGRVYRQRTWDNMPALSM
jgi:protein gp37